MVLSNVQILECIRSRKFEINDIAGEDPTGPPFNTGAIDLRLGKKIELSEKKTNMKQVEKLTARNLTLSEVAHVLGVSMRYTRILVKAHNLAIKGIRHKHRCYDPDKCIILAEQLGKGASLLPGMRGYSPPGFLLYPAEGEIIFKKTLREERNFENI